MSENIFEKYYKKYDQWYDNHRFVYLSELEAIKKVLPKKGKGLEIGVGTGRFAEPLGIKYGIDPSPKMLNIAQKKGINAKTGYGEDLPYKNSFFDYVAIIITLCFVKNPQKVLEESARVLKKKGKIIIGIVDKESFLGKFYKNKKSIFYEKTNFLSVNDVINLLKSTGFDSFSFYQTISALPDDINGIEIPEKGFGKKGFIIISAVKPFCFR